MEKNQLIYVFDVLCSWCYATDKEIQQIQDTNKEVLEVKVVSGGMFINDTPRGILDIFSKDQVKPAYQRVSELGGVEISDKYLEDLVMKQNYRLDSKITSMAFSAYKLLETDRSKDLNFIFEMQKSIYVDGLDPNSEDFYKAVAEKCNINTEAFLTLMKSEEAKQLTTSDFNYARQLGVNSYPQVFFRTKNDEYYLIAKGFRKAVDIQQIIDSILSEKN
ncbi:MAG: DsbA family protein [Mesonia hippocampi]|uniref:DsbA family protein n=1 Tax=Mesonia hippocampi TaxID=1628250 RepID=UPI003F9DB608